MFMNIVLREVTKENWYECTKLKVSEAQRAFFAGSVVHWIAESRFEESYRLLAIYDGDMLVGFSVYGYDVNDHHWWVVAFMIDENHQRKGYGRVAMREIIDLLKDQYGCRRVKLGHRPNNTVAARLYESLGFREVGRTEKEVIRCLEIEG
jgi:diamine N-acetyltransferase